MSVYPQDIAPVQQAMVDGNRVRPMVVAPSRTGGNLVYTSYAHPDIKKMFCLHTLQCECWQCGFSDHVANNLAKSTYVKVYDNRIEWNEPTNFGSHYTLPGLCNICNWACHQSDNISTVHYDRALVGNAVVAQSCCRPCMTHSECCPNGCMCFEHGESIVLYANTPKCDCSACACCKCICTPRFQCCKVKDVDQYTSTNGSIKQQTTAARGAICCGPHRIIKGVDNATQLAAVINNARNQAQPIPVILGIAPADIKPMV